MGNPVGAGGRGRVVDVCSIGNNSASNIGIPSSGTICPMDTIIYDPNGHADLDQNRIIVPETADDYMIIATCATDKSGGSDSSYGTSIKVYVDNADVGAPTGDRSRGSATCLIWPYSLSAGQAVSMHVRNSASDGSRYIPGGISGVTRWRPRLMLFKRPDPLDEEFQV